MRALDYQSLSCPCYHQHSTNHCLQNVRCFERDSQSILLHFIYYSTLILSLFDSSNSPGEARRRRERGILEELHASTVGGNRKRKLGWLSDAPVGQWHGITTDGEGYITEIDLRNQNLSGDTCVFLISCRHWPIFGAMMIFHSSLMLLSCIRLDPGLTRRAHELDEAVATWKPADRLFVS